MRPLKEEEAKNISVGDVFYKTARNQSKYKVQVVGILDGKEVMVKGLCKGKRNGRKEAKPFKTYITTLYTTQAKGCNELSKLTAKDIKKLTESNGIKGKVTDGTVDAIVIALDNIESVYGNGNEIVITLNDNIENLGIPSVCSIGTAGTVGR